MNSKGSTVEKNIHEENSTDAQSFVFAVISFLSQIIVFPLFQLHWHTFPHPKTKEKQKLPDIKN